MSRHLSKLAFLAATLVLAQQGSRELERVEVHSRPDPDPYEAKHISFDSSRGKRLREGSKYKRGKWWNS